jgi:hypothetical protein
MAEKPSQIMKGLAMTAWTKNIYKQKGLQKNRGVMLPAYLLTFCNLLQLLFFHQR